MISSVLEVPPGRVKLCSPNWNFAQAWSQGLGLMWINNLTYWDLNKMTSSLQTIFFQAHFSELVENIFIQTSWNSFLKGPIHNE